MSALKTLPSLFGGLSLPLRPPNCEARIRRMVCRRNHDRRSDGRDLCMVGDWLVGSLNRRSLAERFNLRGGSSDGGRKVFAVCSGAELRARGRSATEKGEVFALAEWRALD
jgi:hypothetical protein